MAHTGGPVGSTLDTGPPGPRLQTLGNAYDGLLASLPLQPKAPATVRIMDTRVIFKVDITF